MIALTEWTDDRALARVDWLKGEALEGNAASLAALRELLDEAFFPDAGKAAAAQAIADLGAGPVEDQSI